MDCKDNIKTGLKTVEWTFSSRYCPVASSSECDNELSVSAESAGIVVPVQDMKACGEMEL
jgi:hypothetical protein